MTTRPTDGVTTYHVSPEGRVWKIKLAGDGFVEWADSKADAIARARVLASRAPHGEVVVLDGQTAVEPVGDAGVAPKPS